MSLFPAEYDIITRQINLLKDNLIKKSKKNIEIKICDDYGYPGHNKNLISLEGGCEYLKKLNHGKAKLFVKRKEFETYSFIFFEFIENNKTEGLIFFEKFKSVHLMDSSVVFRASYFFKDGRGAGPAGGDFYQTKYDYNVNSAHQKYGTSELDVYHFIKPYYDTKNFTIYSQSYVNEIFNQNIEIDYQQKLKNTDISIGGGWLKLNPLDVCKNVFGISKENFEEYIKLKLDCFYEDFIYEIG